MLPRLCLIAVVVPCAMAAPLQAQVVLGAYGGLNRSTLNGDGPQNAKYQNRRGTVFGVVVDLPVAVDVAISVQPSLVQRGTGIAFEIQGEPEPRDSLDLQLDYLSIPVLLKIFAGHRRTFVTGGVDVGFLTSATMFDGAVHEDLSDVMKKVDIAAVFGLGVAVLKRQPEITLELRYTQSLLNIANPESNPEGESLPLRFRSTGLQLLVGVMFAVGR